MRRLFTCLAAVSAAALTATTLAATPAQADGPPPALRRTVAADPYAYTPPPEQLLYNWSGFYLGGHLGSAWTERQGTMTTFTTEGFGARGSSFAGGAQAGYMHQFRELVVGAEVKTTRTGSESSSNSLAFPGINVTTRVNATTMVTGRLGYAYMNWLAYSKAGWATAKIDMEASGTATGSASVRGNGWVAGAGLSYAFGPNIIGGIEYDYVRLNADNAVLVPTVASVSSTGFDVQSVTLRLDFKFGH